MILAGARLVKGVFTRKISGDVHLASTSIFFARIVHRRRARQKYSSSLGVGFHRLKTKWVVARDNKILRRLTKSILQCNNCTLCWGGLVA